MAARDRYGLRSVPALTHRISNAAARIRLLVDRTLSSMGLGDDAFLLVIAALIGLVTAAAAVGFHELIVLIRTLLYTRGGPDFLYGRGVWLLIVIPAAGGLAVGAMARFVFREREGHGIVDVLESAMRTGGLVRPLSAVDKIVTSATTIGTGGSAGAEGPIVQIGAAIASGIGQLFSVAKPHLPVLIGCGSAAGISAIFNSPIGGLLFTLEVVLRDFSIRTLTPLVIASVIANFSTQAIFHAALHENYNAIFRMPENLPETGFNFAHLGNVILLGVACGVAGAVTTRSMHRTEQLFGRAKVPRWIRPAIGGAALGAIGVLYVFFSWKLFGRQKFIPFERYPMPSFFGDGYGAVQAMLEPAFYQQLTWGMLALVLLFLLVAKIIGTCLTLGSGGAGGIIAPSLFIGAVTGGALGIILGRMHISQNLPPHAYALIGMGAVLAAVVHAPIAAVLILVDVTHGYQTILPAMLACVTATGVSRLISRDSIYTLSLRMRGVQVGTSSDLFLLRRMTIEQLALEPATVVHASDPLQKILDLSAGDGTSDFVVLDKEGHYLGLVVGEDIRHALYDREAVPLLLVQEIMRSNLPIVRNTDDLATVLNQFSAHDVSRLPVGLPGNSARVIGLVSRAALMRRYQQALAKD
jgi:CIC family chloride channel protein